MLIQLICVAAISPLLSGVISKVKNNLRMRQGPGVFQPYFNLGKLFSKQEVVSENASWIFRFTPFIVFASSLTALVLTPMAFNYGTVGYIGDFIVIFFIFALGRFFLCLAGLDTASAFGGMGSSREMFISGLAEPVAFLALFGLLLRYGTTNPAYIGGLSGAPVSVIFAAAALFMVVLAETSRIPVDNQETHLELTMIHEAMVLEYSGRPLALIEMASYLKQIVWFLLIGNILFPASHHMPQALAAAAQAVVFTSLKLLGIGVIVGVLEVSVAKMRLFKAGDFFAFGFALAVLSVVCAILGV